MSGPRPESGQRQGRQRPGDRGPHLGPVGGGHHHTEGHPPGQQDVIRLESRVRQTGSLSARQGCLDHNLMGRAVNESGLPKGTTSHDLRHHYASVLLAAGEPVVAVAERLGHEDASLVLSTYGQLMPDSDDRRRSAIDAAWDTTGASCAPDVPRAAQTAR